MFVGRLRDSFARVCENSGKIAKHLRFVYNYTVSIYNDLPKKESADEMTSLGQIVVQNLDSSSSVTTSNNLPIIDRFLDSLGQFVGCCHGASCIKFPYNKLPKLSYSADYF